MGSISISLFPIPLLLLSVCPSIMMMERDVGGLLFMAQYSRERFQYSGTSLIGN